LEPHNNDDYLKINNLNKSFNVDGEELKVLNNINLSIKSGEFICIIGSSGCGKSTLLRIIAGLEGDYRGDVILNNKRITKPGLDRGVVFQEPRLFPWLTIRENLRYALLKKNNIKLSLQNKNKEEKNETVEKHMKLVGLKGFENAYPHQLSGGMAQRASIARALVNRPNILLLDEPFGALDAFTKIQMQKEILRISEAEKATMILVTHDIDEAVFLADRIIVMSSRPGFIKEIIPVKLSRPRNRNSNDFTCLRKLIYEQFFTDEETKEDYVI
jgi:sulfonate transport system ATP-binding protein